MIDAVVALIFSFTLSEGLLAVSTVFWCQAMPTRMLLIYAFCVGMTAVGKVVWEYLC